MSTEENGYVNADRLLEESRKDVQISTGKVRIRRVGISVFMQAFGNAPDLSALMSGADEKNPPTGPRGDVLARGVRAILLVGVEEPKLCVDPAEGATPSDFSWPDQELLMIEIVKHSGFNKEAAEACGLRIHTSSAPVEN